MAYGSHNKTDKPRMFGRYPNLLAIGGLSYYAMGHFGPVFHSETTDPNWSSLIAAGLLIGTAMTAASDVCRAIAGWLELKAHKTAEGHNGKARFAELCEIEHEITKDGLGPYWGSVDGRAITSDFASNALVIGPPGSKKSVGQIVPTIWNIHAPKVVLDFKGELACILAEPLRRRGERVVILNISELYSEVLGTTATYNPLNLVADNFVRLNGLRDVFSDIDEISQQQCPEPEQKGDNHFFEIGSNGLVAYADLTSVLIDGMGATFADVRDLLNDRERLLGHAQWGCGALEKPDGLGFAEMDFSDAPWIHNHSQSDVDDFVAEFRSESRNVVQLLSAKDSKTADSFITGAQQALRKYSRAMRAHTVMRSSSFRFTEMKGNLEQDITVFLIADAARINTQRDVLSMTQFGMFSEFMRHPNTHRKVYVISDETSNFKIHGLI